jgi:hypoxanthine phosphoribosyltransferase
MEHLRLETRYEADRITGRVRELAAHLDGLYANDPPVLVAVLKGASFLLADVARQMNGPLACEYIAVSRQAEAEILQIDFATAFPIANRSIVLLKDVVHTGVVETYLMTHLTAAGAASIRLVSIVDKKPDRTTDVVVDFALFSSDRGRFVGYGMEHAGRYAHLPYIAEIYGVGAESPAGPEASPPKRGREDRS